HSTSLSDLAPEIARHGADEDKHGRVFDRPRRKRGPPPGALPPGTGVPEEHGRAGRGRPPHVGRAHPRPVEHRAANTAPVRARASVPLTRV
ncbi:hypothetical protein ACE14D_13150, partial [Streptomyces sp. Act-28]